MEDSLPSPEQRLLPPIDDRLADRRGFAPATLRPSVTHPGVDDRSHYSQRFLQTLHDVSEHEALHLLSELRRTDDISTLAQHFSR